MHEAVTPPDFIPEAVQQPDVDEARRFVASRTDRPARPRVHAARHVGSATAVRRERPSPPRSEPPAGAAVSAGPEPVSTALVTVLLALVVSQVLRR